MRRHSGLIERGRNHSSNLGEYYRISRGYFASDNIQNQSMQLQDILDCHACSFVAAKNLQVLLFQSQVGSFNFSQIELSSIQSIYSYINKYPHDTNVFLNSCAKINYQLVKFLPYNLKDRESCKKYEEVYYNLFLLYTQSFRFKLQHILILSFLWRAILEMI